jgi:hypothetical protein
MMNDAVPDFSRSRILSGWCKRRNLAEKMDFCIRTLRAGYFVEKEPF